MKNKYLIALIFLFVGSQTIAQDTFTDQKDIPQWSQQAIHTLKHLQVISGTPKGEIQPNKTINRAEFCKIIIQATKASLVYPANESFPDVTKDDWFYAYVETAKNKGWLKGYPDGTFKPGQTINRAEIAKILSQAFRLETKNLNTASQWYLKYFSSLDEQGLLAHDSGFENLIPEKNPTRAEVLEQIYRAMKRFRYFEEQNIPPLPNISETNTSQNTPSANTYSNTQTLHSTTSPNAGALSLTKISQKKRVQAKTGQDIDALSINIKAEKNDVTLSALQFRRIGNGSFNDFDKVWLEINGTQASDKINPQNDIVTLTLNKPDKITLYNTKTYTLKTTIKPNTKTGSSRFVLYLPEWIQADTKAKTGFFPFGGVDIEIQ